MAMKVVYDDFGGAHSTQVAAAMHLGHLPVDKVASAEQLMKLPMFDRITKEHHGFLIFMGKDDQGHEIYICGRGAGHKIVERAVASAYQLVGGADISLRFINTLPCVNWWMRIGGYLSRSLGWIWLGRPLVIFGTQRAYMQLAKVVAQVKDYLTTSTPTGFIGSDGADLSGIAHDCTILGLVPGINTMRQVVPSRQD